jgi:hypothetical protein
MKTVSCAWLEMAESLTMDDIVLSSRQGELVYGFA